MYEQDALRDLQLDILTWCDYAQINPDGGLNILATYVHVFEPSFPVKFVGTAVLRFRGRDLPSPLRLRWQIRTMDEQPLGPMVENVVEVPPPEGGWQVVSRYCQVRADLPDTEQNLCVDLPDLNTGFRLPLPVILGLK